MTPLLLSLPAQLKSTAEDDEKGKDYDRRAGSRHCLVIMSRGRGPKGGMREEEDTGRAGDCGRLADREHDLSNATDRKQMVPATSFWASSPLLNRLKKPESPSTSTFPPTHLAGRDAGYVLRYFSGGRMTRGTSE